VSAAALGLVAAPGATLPAAPIGAAALGSEATEPLTGGEGEALSRGRCAKATDANPVAIIAVITSTRNIRLKASFHFSFSEVPPTPSLRGQFTGAAMNSRRCLALPPRVPTKRAGYGAAKGMPVEKERR
jgi:hypothetical protein